ncbi:MAG: hypothetical protein BroJett040_14340 [Oligoflexia bacterium]|nr:MAG: hypothetical protein BroJett040_14340 [Oligoflexia bacterium]
MSDNMDSIADALAAEAAAAAGNTAENSGAAGGGGESSGDEFDKSLQMIMDIPLRVTVELGRAKMPVNDLLKLTQGSVVELNKLAGEPMEVLVNDKMIARGEAVVVNEKFGIRLTDIISTKERVEQLK